MAPGTILNQHIYSNNTLISYKSTYDMMLSTYTAVLASTAGALRSLIGVVVALTVIFA